MHYQININNYNFQAILCMKRAHVRFDKLTHVRYPNSRLDIDLVIALIPISRLDVTTIKGTAILRALPTKSTEILSADCIRRILIVQNYEFRYAPVSNAQTFIKTLPGL